MLKKILTALAVGVLAVGITPMSAYAADPVHIAIDCYDNADVDVFHPTLDVPFGADIILDLDDTGNGLGSGAFCKQIEWSPLDPTDVTSLLTLTTYTIPAADCANHTTFRVQKDTEMYDYIQLNCLAAAPEADALPNTGVSAPVMIGAGVSAVALILLGVASVRLRSRKAAQR